MTDIGRSLVGWACLAFAVAATTPALAAHVARDNSCGSAAKAVCANSKLQVLAARLSAAYAAALARDPAHAENLELDQLDWSGERNQHRSTDPSDLYNDRIAFLDNVDNPAATRGLPIARKLLAVVSKLPVGTESVLQALASTGLVAIAQPLQKDGFRSVSSAIAALPAAPVQSLRAALNASDPSLYGLALLYLPSAKLGGAFNVQGTAECEDWTTFSERNKVMVPTPPSKVLDGCELDGGATGYLALIDKYPVAIDEIASANSYDVDLEWQRWLGDKWGPVVDIRIRFAWNLHSDLAANCRATPLGCEVSRAALRAMQTYLRDGQSMQRPAWLTAPDLARFSSMQAHIQTQQSGCQFYKQRFNGLSSSDAFWFPFRVGGQVVVGCISPGHMGSHPRVGFRVAFWAYSASKLTVPLPGDCVTYRHGAVLAAARASPRQVSF